MASEEHDNDQIAEQSPKGKGLADGPVQENSLASGSNYEKLESEVEYPSGISFTLLTIGLMAVVLVLALDNYIICQF